jgi:hypothetical protein
MTKAAAEKFEYPKRERPQLTNELNNLRRQNDRARHAAIKAAYAVVETMDKCAEYFRDPTSVPFTVAQKNAAAVLGSRVEKLMQKVATDKTVAYRQRKEKTPQLLTEPIDWTQAPYSLIKSALDAVDAFAATQESLKQTEVATAEKRAELLRPFCEGLSSPVILGSVWSEKTAISREFAALTAANALGDITSHYAQRIQPKDKEELVQDSMNALSDPAHEDKLRAIKSQAMLHELIAGDPVISGYGYNDTIDAYNHLAEIAPKAMQQRVTAQAMLRKYLEQSSSMDPFDTKMLMDTEDSTGKRDMPSAMQGYLTGSQRELGAPMPSKTMQVEAPKKPASIFDKDKAAPP